MKINTASSGVHCVRPIPHILNYRSSMELRFKFSVKKCKQSEINIWAGRPAGSLNPLPPLELNLNTNWMSLPGNLPKACLGTRHFSFSVSHVPFLCSIVFQHIKKRVTLCGSRQNQQTKTTNKNENPSNKLRCPLCSSNPQIKNYISSMELRFKCSVK